VPSAAGALPDGLHGGMLATRRTPSEWCFAIGAVGPPPAGGCMTAPDRRGALPPSPSGTASEEAPICELGLSPRHTPQPYSRFLYLAKL